MRQPAQEYPVRREVDWPELHVGLQEVAFLREGHLEQPRQLRIVGVRANSGVEHDIVGPDPDELLYELFLDIDAEVLSLLDDPRRGRQVVPQEDDAEACGLIVVLLREAVCPDVPVQDEHVRAGMPLLDPDGVGHRRRAAYPGAVRPLGCPRADALDDDDVPTLELALRQQPPEVRLSDDSGVLPVHVLRGSVLGRPCGDDYDPVLDRLPALEHRLEIAYVPLALGNLISEA